MATILIQSVPEDTANLIRFYAAEHEVSPGEMAVRLVDFYTQLRTSASPDVEAARRHAKLTLD
jgi:hypothetical protein